MLLHHSRLPASPRSTSDDPYFGPYKILSVDGHRITVRCSPRQGGTLVCAAQHLKRYYDPEDLCGEELELNDEKIAALDLKGAASPMEVEGELPDMKAEEMAKEGFYLVKSVLRHRYRQGWRFFTLWEGFGVEEAEAVAGASPQRDRRSPRRRKNDLSRGVIPDWEIAIFIVNFIDFRNNLINFPSAPLQRPCSQD